jgi:hypothetical protein
VFSARLRHQAEISAKRMMPKAFSFMLVGRPGRRFSMLITSERFRWLRAHPE